MIEAGSSAEAKAGVSAAIARFWQMVHRERYPTVMPMTSAVAPRFSRRHPRAAIIFDNLHMMHDIISDVLLSPEVPRARKREVIYRQLAEFRSARTNVIPLEEWSGMAAHMGGVEAMGGPAVGLLAPAAPAMPVPGRDSLDAPATPEEHQHR
jgi:hypothetical protein